MTTVLATSSAIRTLRLKPTFDSGAELALRGFMGNFQMLEMNELQKGQVSRNWASSEPQDSETLWNVWRPYVALGLETAPCWMCAARYLRDSKNQMRALRPGLVLMRLSVARGSMPHE